MKIVFVWNREGNNAEWWAWLTINTKYVLYWAQVHCDFHWT